MQEVAASSMKLHCGLGDTCTELRHGKQNHLWLPKPPAQPLCHSCLHQKAVNRGETTFMGSRAAWRGEQSLDLPSPNCITWSLDFTAYGQEGLEPPAQGNSSPA